MSAAVFLSACDINLRAAPPEASLKIGGLNCLSQIGPTVSSYLDDKLSEAEITEFFTCMQKSFLMFEGLTRGSKQGEYSPEEIRTFLHRYFIKDRKISDKLLSEFMLVKKTLVGGTVDVIRRQDLHEAVFILETLRKEAIRLKPHLRVLNFQLVEKEPKEGLAERIKMGHKKLYESIEVVVDLLAKAQQPYSIQNFEFLTTELRQFVKWDDHFQSTRPIGAWMELLRHFKDVTVSPSDRITARDWRPLLSSCADWYMLFIEIRSLLSLSSIWESDDLVQLHATVTKALRWVREATNRQATKVIEFERLSKLYASVEKMGWLGSKWPLVAVEKIFKAAVTKILGDAEVAPSQRTARGITGIHVTRFEQEFAQWFEYQSQIEVGALLNYHSFPSRPLYVPHFSGVALLESIDSSYSVDRFNYTIYNALRSISKLVIRGYAAKPQLGLTRDELQEVYLDIRDLAIAWKLADPREDKTGKRAFLEGNLFTYNANGNDYLEAGELVQLLAFLKSGGQIGTAIYEQMLPHCRGASLDVHGESVLSRGCVINYLSDNLWKMTPNMPGFSQFFKDLDPTHRKSFVMDLLQTVFGRSSTEATVESSEITALAAVLHYQEAVFSRYNADLDYKLEGAELDQAFETFRWLIKTMAEVTCQPLSESRVRLAFNYILRYQEIPEANLKTWLRFQMDGDPILGRYHLNLVFKTIIRKITETGGNPTCK